MMYFSKRQVTPYLFGKYHIVNKGTGVHQKKTLGYYIGAEGVDSRENRAAKRVGLIFEVPMLLAALWILFNWWAESVNQIDTVGQPYYDLTLWGLFVVETALLSWLVSDTYRYLRGNWLNLIIVLLGVPVLLGWDINIGALRMLRILAVFALLLHIGSGVRKMLSRNELGTTLAASLVVIVMSGIMMTALDPGVDTPWDGIWWAWVTVTTVGYGDVVPLTLAGRAFGGLIILMGIGLFSMITASFAAFFISRQEEEIVSSEEHLSKRVIKLEQRLLSIESKLDQLLQKKSL